MPNKSTGVNIKRTNYIFISTQNFSVLPSEINRKLAQTEKAKDKQAKQSQKSKPLEFAADCPNHTHRNLHLIIVID